MKGFWKERYVSKDYAYGFEPIFFRKQLENLPNEEALPFCFKMILKTLFY
jgi:hypothetical protein